ncbi:DUF3379 family protein [Vibrio sp. B172a]|uniref:DUF3379 family protein n=1 Tax=Vibrio sp. B172a TaxID=2835790 RepID=UPI0025521D6A|nr:DUF3379 family protein [Vibrio sp. B172a]MDK9782327.1 DUF3379 family protein [Vibrio sp. B172a]
MKRNVIKTHTLKILSISFFLGIFTSQVNWNNFMLVSANAGIADTALQRVIRDHEFVMGIDEDVSIRHINAKMYPFNYKISEDFPYEVRYLNHCGFGGVGAFYMIFQGKYGDISFFLTNSTSEESFHTNKGERKGFTMPFGELSIVLIGNKNEDLENVADVIITTAEKIK